MGLTITVKDAQPTMVYRKNKKGTLELIEARRDEYVTVPQGYYRLRLVGISEPFELDGNFGVSMKVRMEWMVIASHTPAGRGSVNGRFSDMVNFTLGPRSNLGKIVSALTGEELDLGATIDVTDYIGLELEGTVTNTTKPDKQGVTQTYTNISYDTLAAIEDEEEEDEAPAPPPAKKAKAAPVKNPILDEDEDES